MTGMIASFIEFFILVVGHALIRIPIRIGMGQRNQTGTGRYTIHPGSENGVLRVVISEVSQPSVGTAKRYPTDSLICVQGRPTGEGIREISPPPIFKIGFLITYWKKIILSFLETWKI